MDALIFLIAVALISKRALMPAGDFWTWWAGGSGLGGLLAGLTKIGSPGNAMEAVIMSTGQWAACIAVVSLLPAAICWAIRLDRERKSHPAKPNAWNKLMFGSRPPPVPTSDDDIPTSPKRSNVLEDMLPRPIVLLAFFGLVWIWSLTSDEWRIAPGERSDSDGARQLHGWYRTWKYGQKREFTLSPAASSTGWLFWWDSDTISKSPHVPGWMTLQPNGDNHREPFDSR